MKIWQMQLILQCLGEEALFKMEPIHVVALLVDLKACQIHECRGSGKWNMHTDEEKEAADIQIIEEVGQWVLDGLPTEKRRQLTVFI